MKTIYYDLLDGCLKQTYALVKSILLFFLDAVNLQNLLLGNMNEGGHCGVSATLTQLRKKYWVPKGSSDNQGTRKSYVSLFTCAVTRAVHLELVSDMSTKCFYFVLRRFLARRDKGIHWKFIVERAPWWGGFYERLVKTIKDPLRKILGRALLTFEELSTILSEVEVIVNHRPLTYVENDPGEPEPLTPAHFLELGYGDSEYPIHFIELIDATTAKESYKKRKTYRTLLLKQLFGDAGKNSICSS
ncbi:integrase catalytic domain-containing protein [Trichonephila clavipes]|nr:integrase catalytic domain-containing protein [Trichonephila clavipes]